MSIRTSSGYGDLRRVLGLVLGAPVRPQTYRNLLYLLAMFPRGIAYFTLLVSGFATGIGLLVVLVGAPILVALLAIVVHLAAFERFLAEWLLGVDVSVEPIAFDGDLVDWTRQLVTDRRTWTDVAYLFSVYVYGSLAFGLLASFAATAGSFLLAPLYYERAPVVAYGPIPTGEFALDLMFGWDNLLIGLATTFQVGTWRVETLPGALLVACLGIVLLLALLHLANGLARAWGRYARAMLAAPGRPDAAD